MADALKGCAAAVILSGYHSPLYDEMFSDWYQVEIDAHTGQANGPAETASRVEVLWSNHDICARANHGLDFGDWGVTA
jgi:DNA adenine methylase